MLNKSAFLLVLLMALLQAFYGLFAYIDPLAFSALRGTVLASQSDMDWVRIYASRTLFIALLLCVLLYLKHYKILMWAALLGTVMPIVDGWLAYQAGASIGVIAKHGVVLVYLLLTSVVLRKAAKMRSPGSVQSE